MPSSSLYPSSLYPLISEFAVLFRNFKSDPASTAQLGRDGGCPRTQTGQALCQR